MVNMEESGGGEAVEEGKMNGCEVQPEPVKCEKLI